MEGREGVVGGGCGRRRARFRLASFGGMAAGISVVEAASEEVVVGFGGVSGASGKLRRSLKRLTWLTGVRIGRVEGSARSRFGRVIVVFVVRRSCKIYGGGGSSKESVVVVTRRRMVGVVDFGCWVSDIWRGGVDFGMSCGQLLYRTLRGQ